MRVNRERSRLVVAGAAALLASLSHTANAGSVCAARKITATGKSSTMTFFAKTRARAAWVAKVSAEPRLGPTYAQWLRARDRRLVCRSVDRQYICLAAALPCRSAGATTTSTAASSRPISARQRPL
jgi:hypothetical protein